MVKQLARRTVGDGFSRHPTGGAAYPEHTGILAERQGVEEIWRAFSGFSCPYDIWREACSWDDALPLAP